MPGDTYYSLYPSVRPGFRPAENFNVAETEAVQSQISTTVTLDVEGSDDGSVAEHGEASIDIHLYGPGDIMGLDADRIVRREPEPATRSHPPRQFPVVEFDRADLPWLFSPQHADSQGRLHPWLTLVVVEETHPDVELEPLGGGSNPVLEAPSGELPPVEESYLWAHAQLLHDDDVDPYEGDEEDDVESDEDDDPVPLVPPMMESDSIHSKSRLVCPRNLEPQTEYLACLVPVFEPGRRAGLGLEPYPDDDHNESGGQGDESEDDGDESEDDDLEIAFAWDEEDVRLPVYDSWAFSTSTEGDFLSLAKALDPEVLGPEIGIRDVDVSAPGPTDLKRTGENRDHQTVGLEGALRSVAVNSNEYDNPTELRTLLNRTVILEEELPEDVVAPPLYGRWYRRDDHLSEFDSEDTSWFEDCNLDPRYRMTAGFGTEVVQEHQEELMAVAWEQFGDLRELNRQQAVGELVRDSFEDHIDRVETLTATDTLGLGSLVLDDVVLAADLRERIDSHLGTDLGAGITCAGALDRVDWPHEPLTPRMQKLTGVAGPLGRSNVDVRDNLSGLVGQRTRSELSQGWITGENGAWESSQYPSDQPADEESVDPSDGGVNIPRDGGFGTGGGLEPDDWTTGPGVDEETTGPGVNGGFDNDSMGGELGGQQKFDDAVFAAQVEDTQQLEETHDI